MGFCISRRCFLFIVLGYSSLGSVVPAFSPMQVCCLRDSNSSFLQCQNSTTNARNNSSSEECGNNTKYTCYNLTRIEPCSRNDSRPAENAKKDLHIGVFVQQLSRDSRGYFVGMKLATNLINNRTDILANYTLVLHGEDTHWVSLE